MTPQKRLQQFLCQHLPILPRVELPLHDLCQVISAERRRHAIIVLTETGTNLTGSTASLSIQQLAADVAAIEATTAADNLSPADYRAVQIGLYHHHLGVLEQNDLIEWHEAADTIQPTQRLMPIGALLRILQHYTLSPEVSV